ncbi:hypothetical protein Tco_0842060 [Tanacetum coccineum]|uniref:Reverse transcriptase domain-containing protein n=1 Tax=Tanacetum coccineum TaxID=301880 RepID=A0ABQ5AZH3_9ASTR
MESLTTRIDSQFKEIRGDIKEMRDRCTKCGGPYPIGDWKINLWRTMEEKKKQTKHQRISRRILRTILWSKFSPLDDNPETETHTLAGKTYNPLANLNTKTAIFLDDSEDEAEEVKKEGEPLPKKPTQTDKPPLKTYKLKIPYPQRLNKEKIEARYAKFLDMINEVRINVPLVDVLAGMPNYGKFLKDLIPPKLGDPGIFLIPCKLANSVEYLALVDLGASINLMLYSLYAALSGTTLKSQNARVKNKELNLGIEEDRATFHIDKAMQHSHVNDDTCFRMDVIDEITEDELDALLNDSKPFLNTSEKLRETTLDKEFDEFMSGNVQEDVV